jgi:hypothetical protein
MILVSIVLIFNVIAFYLNINTNIDGYSVFYIVFSLLVAYKGTHCNNLNEAFNIKCFEFKLNKERFFELISSFLVSLSFSAVDIYYGNFNLIDAIILILYALFIYRFFMFNFFKRACTS